MDPGDYTGIMVGYAKNMDEKMGFQLRFHYDMWGNVAYDGTEIDESDSSVMYLVPAFTYAMMDAGLPSKIDFEVEYPFDGHNYPQMMIIWLKYKAYFKMGG